MTKIELRQKYKKLRKGLKPEEIETFSLAIANKLIKIPIWENTYFHIFLTIKEHNEVDTEFIIPILFGKNKEVIIAKSNFETTTMVHYLLTDNTKITKNEFNISEPIDGLEVPISQIEVVFVPLLAFDEMGHRTGYGKGFYDKFLANCKKEVIKIGFSFFDAEPIISDIYENDVQLDYCITPNRIYQFAVR
jgi:5-formyltetrahydrofolate cyclo-ligase